MNAIKVTDNASAVPPVVLIVDDEPNIVLSLEILLKRAGFAVFSAGDGEAGWTMAQAKHPSVILLDVMMPKRNGYEFCRLLRADPVLMDTKVIMLTAKGRTDEVSEGLSFGADAYMSKPFSTREVLRQVRELLTPSLT